MSSFRIKAVISIIIVAILLLLLSTLIYSLLTIKKVRENLEVQVNTRSLIIALKDNLTYMLSAETGGRGFLVTGDTAYLRPYEEALEKISSSVAQLRDLTGPNPQHQGYLDSLESYIGSKLAFIKQLNAHKLQDNNKVIAEIMASDRGKFWMDKIRAINEKMQKEEGLLLEERRVATNRSIASARMVFITEGALALVITIFLAYLIFKDLNRRARTERRLRDYNTQLEQKNKEIEQFAYITSHDLQEPLRTISNFSSLLEEKLEKHPDDEARRYLRLINTGATRMSNLIFALLEYSRLGKEAFKTTIDCNIIMEELVADMVMAINERGAVVKWGSLPVVNGYTFLKLLFQNLLSNAFKFSNQNVQPLVTVSATERKDDYLFTVKDNGIGIEKEYYDRIFVIFQRLHSRSAYPGTGIGLAQCRKIVELHGGKIWVESLPGQGSTFNFTLEK